jgi:hypothetical protein
VFVVVAVVVVVVVVVDFVIDSVRKLLDTPSYISILILACEMPVPMTMDRIPNRYSQ